MAAHLDAPLEGLDGVVAASTRVSEVDGEAGRLLLAGYPVEELAPSARFEEVAHPAAPSTLILNGHIYVVSALDWYGRHSGDYRATELARQGLRGLQYILHRFDNNGLSFYDLFTRAHICGYHTGHVVQLRHLYEVTGVGLFDVYAKRWAATKCPR